MQRTFPVHRPARKGELCGADLKPPTFCPRCKRGFCAWCHGRIENTLADPMILYGVCPWCEAAWEQAAPRPPLSSGPAHTPVDEWPEPRPRLI